MSGSGTYAWYYGTGPYESFSASGSSGSDSVSLSIDQGEDLDEFGFPGLPTGLGPIDEWGGSVMIDGISGVCQYCFFGNTATWGLGGGGGSIRIYDSSNQQNLLAAATLIGYINYTNVTETFTGNTLRVVTASFDIDPTPEPRSWVLLGLGLAVLARKALTYRY
jgi:hypothetical protein